MGTPPDPGFVFLDPDAVLDDLAKREFGTEADVLAALAEATSVINATASGEAMPYQNQQADTFGLANPRSFGFINPRIGVGVVGFGGGGVTFEKLDERIGKVVDIARRGAAQFHATGFSITVGFPLGVSVTVDFEVKP